MEKLSNQTALRNIIPAINGIIDEVENMTPVDGSSSCIPDWSNAEQLTTELSNPDGSYTNYKFIAPYDGHFWFTVTHASSDNSSRTIRSRVNGIQSGLIVVPANSSVNNSVALHFTAGKGDICEIGYYESNSNFTHTAWGCKLRDNVYSSEEQVIGTWIDGKPIYRIVYQNIAYTTAGALKPTIDVSSLNVDTVIRIDGFRYLNNIYYRMGTNCYVYYDTSSKILTGSIFSGTSSVQSGKYTSIIFEYTKTTDNASS